MIPPGLEPGSPASALRLGSAFPRSSDGSTPTFSVVIPSYNRCALVLVAVDSVLGQDFPDFELLVVDDGSVDDTIIRLAAVQDPRLFLVPQPNQGPGGARNNGIQRARGRYVAFLDSDDRFLPNHLSNMLALLRQGPNVAAYSPVIADRGRGRRLLKPPRAISDGENMATYLLCDRGFVQTSGLAVPRELAAATRYRCDVSYGEDADFAIRLQLAGCRFLMSAAPTVIWNDDRRDDRLSQGNMALGDLRWLEDLRPNIPAKAYYGFRGWHLAKNLRPTDWWSATGQYLRAVFHGAYRPRLALIVLCQIYMPAGLYRSLADRWIAMTSGR